MPVEQHAADLRAIVARECAAAGLAVPRLAVEPGRAVAGPTTVTLYEVGTVKELPGVRTYVSVDGGMSDNIRTALYDAEYTAVLAARASDAPPRTVTVCGKHCESGDIVVREVALPADVAPGDLLAVPASGAYHRSMASNYNHVGRPPVVAVRGRPRARRRPPRDRGRPAPPGRRRVTRARPRPQAAVRPTPCSGRAAPPPGAVPRRAARRPGRRRHASCADLGGRVALAACAVVVGAAPGAGPPAPPGAAAAGRTCTCCTTSHFDPVEVV